MSVFAYMDRAVRRATYKMRPIPELFGIGAMRAGTTSLFDALSHHPELSIPTRKELHFFDIHHERGVDWYRAFFPMGEGIAIDISPSYMNNWEAPQRIADLVSGARAVALVREPAARAWSQYRHRIREGTETRSFEDAIEEELAEGAKPFRVYEQPSHIPYLSAGLYAEQLRRWIDVLGADSVLVLDSQSVFTEPSVAMAQVQQFYGLTTVELPYRQVNAAPDGDAPEILDRVRSFFEKPNQDLASLVDISLDWV